MSVSASLRIAAGVTETLETGVDASSSPTIRQNGFDFSSTISATSTVPATKCAFDSAALVAGAYTLDLSNTVGTLGATVDMTGLKVQFILVKNTGSNRITMSQGGSNPYNLGGASFTIPIEAGQTIGLYGADVNPDVASGAKNIAFAGTGTDTFNFIVVAG